VELSAKDEQIDKLGAALALLAQKVGKKSLDLDSHSAQLIDSDSRDLPILLTVVYCPYSAVILHRFVSIVIMSVYICVAIYAAH
jgi:hypothetical protein